MENSKSPFSGPNRIIAKDNETHARVRHVFEHIISEEREPHGEEREKTPEEVILINRVCTVVAEELRTRGVEPKSFPTERIKLLKLTEKSEKEWEAGVETGDSDVFFHDINVRAEVNDFPWIAGILGHELIHIHAFSSLEAWENDEYEIEIDGRSTGLAMAVTDKKTKETTGAFLYLNEALTEMYNQEIMHDLISTLPGFSTHDDYDYRYKEERMTTRKLIQSLFVHNADTYESVAGVERLFFDGYFYGKRLVLARLIEKTFGKGSFRELGERFSKQPVEIDDILLGAQIT